MRLLFSVCLVVATASDAAAQVTLPELPPANSGPAKSLYRDIGGFAQSIGRECVANKPESWEAGFKLREDAVAKFTDANERAAWTTYLADLRAIYKSRLGGLPGLGTFAEIRAKHQQAKVDIEAKLPTATELPADVAQAKALVARVTEYIAFLDGVLATYKAIYDSRCDEKLTANWWPLQKAAESAKQQARNLLSGLAYKDADAINRWASNLPQGKQAEPAKDWWNHINYAGKVLTQVGKAQRFAAKLDILRELGPWLGTSDATMLERNTKTVRDFMAKHAPLIKQLIGEVLLPKVPGSAKQVADFKKYMKDFEGGTILGTPVANKMTSSTYEEWDGGRKYTVVKKVYSNYYVLRPKQPAEGTPTIEGIAPDQICELWSRNLVSYDKGGPSHAPLKQWRGDEDILQGFMLCANKDKKSPLPYK